MIAPCNDIKRTNAPPLGGAVAADDDDGAAATLLRRAAPHSFISDLTEPETGYDTTGCESTTT